MGKAMGIVKGKAKEFLSVLVLCLLLATSVFGWDSVEVVEDVQEDVAGSEVVAEDGWEVPYGA